MFKARLEQRLESGEPKCANCQWWLHKKKTDEAVTKLTPTGMGQCAQKEHLEAGVPVIWTTDLTVCSKWEQRE